MCTVSLGIERKGMDMAYVCLALASLPEIHTTVTLAEPSRIPSYENKHHGNGEERRKEGRTGEKS